MSSKDEPRCFGPVHRLEVAVEILVLRRVGVKEVFSTHQHKVGTAIVKAIPEWWENQVRQERVLCKCMLA